MTRDEILVQMFLEYWKYPVKPVFKNSDGEDLNDNSVEALVLAMYESVKDQALSVYPWRSAQKFVFLDQPQVNNTGDGRYKNIFTLPTDFICANGFWRDKEQHQPIQNQVDVIGKIAKTNKKAFLMQYTSTMYQEEDKLDGWVVEWLKLNLATQLADIGGIDPNTKNFLLQKMEYERPALQNKDFEMSHHDDRLGNEDQFLGDWY